MLEAWGKFKNDGDSLHYHHLAHHCMAVAAIFDRLCRLPVIRNRLETAANSKKLCKIQFSRLSALVFLHDVGKLHPRFQARGWPSDLWNGPKCGHRQEGWAFLSLASQWREHPFHQTLARILCEWGEEVQPLIHAVLAHHGRPVTPPPDPTLNEWDISSVSLHYDWRAESRKFDEAFKRWFSEAFTSKQIQMPNAPRFHHEFAGLVTLADWIGSDDRFFPFKESLDLNYNDYAYQRAKSTLAKIGMDVSAASCLSSPSFSKLTGFSSPNSSQAAVGAIGPDARLVVLEAETGSGKTEAALWRFSQLYSAGRVSGLYFAVPTRAAARQLFDRVTRTMRRVFGNEAIEPILAIPGMLCAGEAEGCRLPHWKVGWDDGEDHTPRRWAAEQAIRFLASTVAVGTVDQAMLAGLTVKHAHARGSALSRSLLVIDEVHASDSYMTEILDRLLEDHLAIGGYAILMSATLGERARVRWTGESLKEYSMSRNVPYPAVWVKGEPGPVAAPTPGRSRTVKIDSIPTMEAEKAVACALTAARQGSRVLIIRNTVKKALETWEKALQSDACEFLLKAEGFSALHHGRFAAEDRLLLDAAVERALVPNPKRMIQGKIVIGTQTLEQSLDIDADLLITDLCPVDVLLQRIGRLHRHNLPRPRKFEEPRAIIMLPEKGLGYLAKPNFENGLGAWKSDGGYAGIYRDLAGLELTRRLVVDISEWQIPAMNRFLVESATHPERIDTIIKEMGESWAVYEANVGGSELAASMLAELNLLNRALSFEEITFPNADEQIATRLGQEGLVLTLDPPVLGPFGAQISRISLPARWCKGISGDDSICVEHIDCGMILSIGSKKFRYSRAGIEEYCSGLP